MGRRLRRLEEGLRSRTAEWLRRGGATADRGAGNRDRLHSLSKRSLRCDRSRLIGLNLDTNALSGHWLDNGRAGGDRGATRQRQSGYGYEGA
jgi:hypothetical protein